jgi:tRNA modification GTPase
MTYALEETIVAIASPAGGAARGIIRASGLGVLNCLSRVYRPDTDLLLEQVTRPTRISGRLRLDTSDRRLPCDLLFWPGRRSYTREPLAELHTIGSPPLLEAALRTLCAVGARVARPGEFTLRAFLAGRLDLTQAEAVLGVIDADNGQQLQIALAQLAGGLAAPLGRLRDGLLELLAELEAGLDFVEEDIEFVTCDVLQRTLQRMIQAVSAVESQMIARAVASELPTVVLCGAPNVGKSSLFNALVESAEAIVADVAGTTRDYLTAQLHLNGLRCLLVDTAGVDAELPRNQLDQAAQHATGRQRSAADIELFCVDATRVADDWERAQLATVSPTSRRIVVLTKSDRISPLRVDAARCENVLMTSSSTGAGLEELRARLARELAEATTTSSSSIVAATATRCRESLRLAREALIRAATIAATRGGEELIAAELRSALEDLGHVVGAVYTDDILDRIFSRFCIGK